MNEFVYGCVGGFIGQFLCYPLDTIKTKYQYKQPVEIKKLYKGLFYPLVSVMLEKSVLFGTYSKLEHNCFVSGLISGILTTFIVTPFENVKIHRQLNSNLSWKQLYLYRGWTTTLFREVPGYAVYFTIYENFPKNGSLLNAAIGGGLSGVGAWAVIYPADTVKTIMQRDNLKIFSAIEKVKMNGGFYRGFSWAMGRAAILHSGVFFGYEFCKKHLKEKNELSI